VKTVLIIQARMGSSRLPGKVLKPLGDSVVLDYDVSRCRQIQNICDVVVATSKLEQDEPIVRWCQENEVSFFRGSEEDVLSRYYECAKTYNPDYVIRVTSDCPFVDYEFANDIIRAMEKKPSDIVLIEGELPRGLVVEMVSFQALEKMHRIGKEKRHREHVTYYAYEFPDQFTHTAAVVPDTMRHPELRITLDTEEDYALLQVVATHFAGDKLVSAQKVVDYLLAHPEVAALNAHIKQKPVV
jgi:spore coat polysaccharide biosynthesis protein SpsF